MAQLGQTFDPADVPPDDRNFDVLPAGQYEAQIVESDVTATKAGTGQILKITWEIISGPFANRKIFQNLNIQNPSADAQRIGQQQLAAICEATGAGAIRDSEELHFKPCLVRINIKKDEKYGDKNEVKGVKPFGGSQAAPRQPAATRTQQAASAPPQQKAAGGSRPWDRR